MEDTNIEPPGIALQGRNENPSLLVYIIVIVFGLGAWISVNGLWVELPLLVSELPESWNLPSYLTVIIQVANIGFIAVMVANARCPSWVRLKPLILVLEVVGVASTILMAFAWHVTAEVPGAPGERFSVGLFVSAFLVALVDCTTSVTFIPFMARFKGTYITAYFIGGGLCSLLPAALALAQGASDAPDCMNKTVPLLTTTSATSAFAGPSSPGGNPQNWTTLVEAVYHPPAFTPTAFFLCVAALMATSLGAFILLNVLHVAKAEQNPDTTKTTGAVPDEHAHLRKSGSPAPGQDAEIRASNDLAATQADSNPSLEHYSKSSRTRRLDEKPAAGFSPLAQGPLLLLVAWTCALSNSALFSIQTFSCLPYGRRAYHLTVVLSNFAQPFACFFPYKVSTRRLDVVGALVLVASALSGYIFYTAATSPTPPLVNSPAGEPIVVFVWVATIGLLAYLKTVQAGMLHGGGNAALVWCGVATQIGSALGAAIMFPLVNVYNLFQSVPDCPQ